MFGEEIKPTVLCDDELDSMESVTAIIREEVRKHYERRQMLSHYHDVNAILTPEVDLTGNEFLESSTLTALQKRYILGKVMTHKYSDNVQPIQECSEADLQRLYGLLPFRSEAAVEHLTRFNPEYNPAHLQFLNAEYHQFLTVENYQQAFAPKHPSQARKYLILGAGPVGLVFAINVMLRGHIAILIDNRITDTRNRYIGLFPEYIVRLTDYGFAPSGFLKWVVLNATSDKSPKDRRKTNRLFLHIQALVRLLTLSVIMLGGQIYRNYEYDLKTGILTDKNTDKSFVFTDFDEVMIATGCAKQDKHTKILQEQLGLELKKSWHVASALMSKIRDIDRATALFEREPIMISRYVMGDRLRAAHDNFKALCHPEVSDEFIEDISHFPSFFILMHPSGIFDMAKPFADQPLILPPSWHVTGLKKLSKSTDGEVKSDFFHILLIGPMFSKFAQSCVENEAAALNVVAQSILSGTKIKKMQDMAAVQKQIQQAKEAKNTLFFKSSFDVFLNLDNIEHIATDGSLQNPDKWQLVSLGECQVGEKKLPKKYFLSGDVLSAPWFKFGLGLSDGFGHVLSYFSDDPSHRAIVESEYKLTIRQLHIANSLMIVRKEFLEYFPTTYEALTDVL